VAGRLLQFVMVYVAQRRLGPAVYGHFTWAMSLALVLTPLTDLGLQLIVTREIARRRHAAPKIAGVALTAKLIAAAITSTLIVAICLTRPNEVRWPAALLGIALVIASFLEFAGYVLRGLQRADLESALLLTLRVSTGAIGLWVLTQGGALTGLSAAYFAGAVIATGAAALIVGRQGVPLVPVLDRAALVPLLREALPVGGAIIVSIAYTRTAVFLLDAREGAVAVGVYGVAQKLVEPLSIVPAALLAAAFPAFIGARASGDEADARHLGRRTVGVLAVCGAVVSVVGAAGAEAIIAVLYGAEYAAAAPVLRWLAVTAVLSFVNYALTHGLIAQNRQRLNLLFAVVMFAFNLGLCLVLIPRFGAPGGAMAAVVSEALLFVLCGAALIRPRH
jgi:O-antigen/teichoic acid export membrane protein